MKNANENYPSWLKLPAEDILMNYKIVYYHVGKLHVFPFEVKPFKDCFVGIAINNIVYFAHQEVIEGPFAVDQRHKLAGTLGKLVKYSPAGSFFANRIKIELPSPKEVKILFDTIRLSRDCIHGKSICQLIPLKYHAWWTATEEENNKKWSDTINAVPVNDLGIPVRGCNIAMMQPVAHLREKDDFVAKVDERGILDEESLKECLLLRDQILNSGKYTYY